MCAGMEKRNGIDSFVTAVGEPKTGSGHSQALAQPSVAGVVS
jgi:hypothetical protein